MKNSIYILLAAAVAALCACSSLETSPEDYYASGNYWQTTAQVESYLPGIYNKMRNIAFNHTIRFGELGAGIYVQPISTNGNNVSDQPIIIHNLSPDVPGVESWGEYYSVIADCNLFIEKVQEADFVPSDERNALLAQVYGLRALLYFDLYRIWGGVPLRLEPDLAAHGESDVKNLYLARSTAKQTMEQIMADIDLSLNLYEGLDGINDYGWTKNYWSEEASKCLAAEIMLWNTKVSVGDYAAVSDGSLLPEAKSLLEEVESSYGLKLLDNFADVFSATNKCNDEIIFAVNYTQGEATNSNGSYLYHTSTGEIHNMLGRDGEPFGDPLQLNSGYNQTYQYIPEMYLQYDGTSRDAEFDAPVDTRADATFINAYIEDEGRVVLNGTMCRKNVGTVSSGTRVMCGDYIFYRLSWVYLTLAEIANWQGSASDYEAAMNKVRARAYGSAWNESLAAEYGSFKENELAILFEKDKEFVQEGQRWWDLRRMQAVKGNESSHLLFQSEANPVADGTAVLSEEFRALWPVSTKIRANDPLLATSDQQNTGY